MVMKFPLAVVGSPGYAAALAALLVAAGAVPTWHIQGLRIDAERSRTAVARQQAISAADAAKACSDGVAETLRQAAARAAAAQKAIAEAASQADHHRARAIDLLRARSAPGDDCQAAADLLRSEP